VCFTIVVDPDVDPEDDEPEDAELPDDPEEADDPDELDVRRGALVAGALELAGARELAGTCSAAEIESIGRVGAMDSALSTGELSALLHAVRPAAAHARMMNLYFMPAPLPVWVKIPYKRHCPCHGPQPPSQLIALSLR
jgi:hypothetical protein